MIRIIVTGAAGRMGRRLVANIAEAEDLKLAGATERPGSEFLGLDAGAVAGVAPQGVRITDDLAGLVDQADAVIDFSTGAVIANARLAASRGLSIVIGTTALTAEDKAELKEQAMEQYKQEQLREIRRQSQPKAQPKPTTAPKAGEEINVQPSLFDL